MFRQVRVRNIGDGDVAVVEHWLNFVLWHLGLKGPHPCTSGTTHLLGLRDIGDGLRADCSNFKVERGIAISVFDDLSGSVSSLHHVPGSASPSHIGGAIAVHRVFLGFRVGLGQLVDPVIAHVIGQPPDWHVPVDVHRVCEIRGVCLQIRVGCGAIHMCGGLFASETGYHRGVVARKKVLEVGNLHGPRLRLFTSGIFEAVGQLKYRDKSDDGLGCV